MPAVEIRGLKQKAVLWRIAGYSSDGNPTVYNPEEINTRWEDGDSQILGKDGSPISINASIMVEEEIDVGSLLWKGTLASLPASPSPIVEVMGLEIVPDVKIRKYQRTLSCSRYGKPLPDQVGTSP